MSPASIANVLGIFMSLLFAGAIVYAVVYILGEIPAPQPVKSIGYIIVFIVVLMYLIKLFNVHF